MLGLVLVNGAVVLGIVLFEMGTGIAGGTLFLTFILKPDLLIIFTIVPTSVSPVRSIVNSGSLFASGLCFFGEGEFRLFVSLFSLSSKP